MKIQFVSGGSLLINSAPNTVPAWPGVMLDQTWYFPVILRSAINRKVTYPSAHQRRQRIICAKSFYYFVFFQNGSGSILLNNLTLPVKKGMILLVGPDEPHSFDGLPDETTTRNEVVFELRDQNGKICTRPWEDVLNAWFGRRCKVPVTGWDIPEILHSAIVHAFNDIAHGCIGEERPFRLQHGLTQLLSLLEDHLAITDRTNAPDALVRAHHLIKADTAGLLTLTSLAKAVGLSANYLSRAFKEKYGITPMKLQLNIRLYATIGLLRTTNLPIKVIATDTGFSSPQHLIKMLKLQTNQTPSEIRKNSAVMH
ncbi:MAG: AraC family transcriptional regulator [Kiritimatiellales bacterium]